MSRMIPFGFPPATAFYLSLYLLTLVVHVVLMNYVLAGSGYLAWRNLAGRRNGTTSSLEGLLRDWLPFSLGAAITAGVAPLLFVQILYKESFYSANLLLFHRWMLILPALILGFYLLYALKAGIVESARPWVRALAALGAFACFAFTGYSWTENHLLGNRGEDFWAAFYAAGSLFYIDPQLIPRLGQWFFGAFPTLCVILAWQMVSRPAGGAGPSPGTGMDAIRLARMAVLGLLLSLGAGSWYFASLEPAVRETVLGSLALPYLVVAAAAGAVQIGGWLRVLATARLERGWLILITVSCALAIIGATAGRESVRLAALDITRLYEQHQAAASVGGLWVFLVFLVFNGGLLWYCLRRVSRSLARVGASGEASG